MLSIFDFAREMTVLAVAVRLLLAAVCGGLIGIERELKRRPAGFRTHILICVGASMTILTNLYLYQVMHLYTDISRLGAQVITGISFIGAGTIIVTKRRRVKGLTTAAGLWTVGIIGLVCGAGYLELAIFATLMVLFAELVLSKLEYRFARIIQDANLYVEYRHSEDLPNIMAVIQQHGAEIHDLEISRINEETDEHYYAAVLSVQAHRKNLDDVLIPAVTAIENVIQIEEI
ncbi:MAG: MgtC/SapB family protein [Oscillospiraceae bacterium]|nr:MgtC/SapB family protein [Oscillospiraceae bacterium]